MEYFWPALALLFIALKLMGVIAWSWIWVLSPLWIGFAIFGAFILGAFIITSIVFGFGLLMTIAGK